MSLFHGDADRFVPEILIDLLERNCPDASSAIEPCSFFLDGVCLLVDISGFTKLSIEYCSTGKSGIDELHLTTNNFMAVLVEKVYGCGGEIIKFAGDAIICIFSNSFATTICTKNGKAPLRRSVSAFGDSLATVSGSVRTGSASLPVNVEQETAPYNAAEDERIVRAEVILRAMRCAEELRAVKTEKLSVHVAMSCGELCFGILGGHENRWEYLISGLCIQELSDCLDEAPRGQAVISAGCAEALLQARTHGSCDVLLDAADVTKLTIPTSAGQDRVVLTRLPSGNYMIVRVEALHRHKKTEETPAFSSQRIRTPHVERLIRQFVPVPIYEDVESGSGLNFVAEIREVTTMFMKWDSYDASGRHRDLLDLQCGFYSAQKILHSIGAYLRQFLVDDKGCVLIACWGMPRLSYLDNAHRALSAAAQIRCKLGKLEMACSFGITSGDVYCGTVGSALRMEYAAIGSAVNMSARLMGKAHGGIFIDDATRFRLPSYLNSSLLTLEPMKVKGREEPLQAYSYQSSVSLYVEEKVVEDHEIPSACNSTLLIFLVKLAENDAEKDEGGPGGRLERSSSKMLSSVAKWVRAPSLLRAVDHSACGLRMIMLIGREGSGRSTIVRWVCKQARERHLPVYNVRLAAKDSHTDYFFWKSLFQLMAPKGVFVDSSAQRTYIRALLSEVYPGAPDVAKRVAFPVLKSVLGITCTYSTSNKEPRSAAADVAQPSVVDGVLVRVFAYLLDGKKSLVILQNACLCDDASLRVLVAVVKLGTASGFLVTALDDSKPRERLSFRSNLSHVRESLLKTPWSKQFCALLQSIGTVMTMKLTNYTPDEIDRMLCAKLKVPTVPAEVTQLVHDFSGGSFFWVREILQFIVDRGTEEFLSKVGGQELERAGQVSTLMSGASPKLHRTPSARQLLKVSSVRTALEARGGSSPTPEQYLDKLVLCRFGTLSSDVQRILRTASIIGSNFHASVLLAVLAPPQQPLLTDALHTLCAQRWLFRDSDIEGLYAFTHPHFHQLTYELTPRSERTSIHRHIAQCMERIYAEDKAQYAQISFHFQQCDNERALVYATLAVDVMLQSNSVDDCGKCLDLLSSAMTCCHNAEAVENALELVEQVRAVIRAIKLKKPSKSLAQLCRQYLSHIFAPVRAARCDQIVPCVTRTEHVGQVETLRRRTSTVESIAEVHCLETQSPTPHCYGAQYPGFPKQHYTSEAEMHDEEKRVKRVLLQQANQLVNALNEKHANFNPPPSLRIAQE